MSVAIVRVPLGCSAPLHPPDAAQEVAFAEFHVKVIDLPLAMESGVALIDAVGTRAAAVAGAAEAGVLGPPPPPPQATSSKHNPSKPWLDVKFWSP